MAAVACGVMLLLEIVWTIRVGLDEPWNDVRLGPAAGWLRGVPLWSAHGEAPLLTRVYGTVGAWIWWPAAAQSTPARAVLVGLLEAMALTIVPVLWLLRLEARRRILLAIATLLMWLAYLLSTPVAPSFHIHVDAPALGFATAALVCIWTPGRCRHTGWRWLGAALVVASVHSKQVMLPLLGAYPAWVMLASDTISGLRAASAVAIVALASVLATLPVVDVEAMLFSLFTGPGGQPWQRGSAVATFAWALGDMIVRATPTALLLTVALLVVYRRAPDIRRWLRANRWILPLLIGLVCLPTTLAGRMKMGGGPNTLAPTLWFVWLAMVVAFASSARRPEAARRALTGVALIVSAAFALRLAPVILTLPSLMERPLDETLMFRAAERHPASVYLPSRSLPTLMADHRADHLDSAIWVREIERRPVSTAYLRRHLPPILERVIGEARTAPYVLPRLPEFRRQVIDPHLPEWVVLVRDDAVPPGRQPALPSLEPPLPRELTALSLGTSVSRALESIDIRVTDRARRYQLVLSAQAPEPLSDTLEVEARLQTGRQEHLLTLVAEVRPDAEGTLQAEWTVFEDLLRPAARVVVLVRGRTPNPGQPQRLTADEVLQRLARAGEE
jgi:hypothetical protein